MTELVALVEDDEVGRLRRRDDGSVEFTYEDSWRRASDAFPVSVSWPLVRKVHAGATVEAFLWGLLPDNASVLGQWAQRFQVSANDAFGLLAHVGKDCAGAVQFIRPERLDAIRAPVLYGAVSSDLVRPRAAGERKTRIRLFPGESALVFRGGLGGIRTHDLWLRRPPSLAIKTLLS